jgi:hypothetical protein
MLRLPGNWLPGAGIDMKHSQHKNLIQLFHKAVDQGR